MGDLASDMHKERAIERYAIQWLTVRISEILGKGPRDKYSILRSIEETKHVGRVASAWEFGSHRDRVDLVEKALSDLIHDKIVRAEPDDHTSLYILNNPLDAIAQSV
jgi:hypothetical protein